MGKLEYRSLFLNFFFVVVWARARIGGSLEGDFQGTEIGGEDEPCFDDICFGRRDGGEIGA